MSGCGLSVIRAKSLAQGALRAIPPLAQALTQVRTLHIGKATVAKAIQGVHRQPKPMADHGATRAALVQVAIPTSSRLRLSMEALTAKRLHMARGIAAPHSLISTAEAA